MKGTSSADSSGQTMLLQIEHEPDKAEILYELYPRHVARVYALKIIRRAIRKYGFEVLRTATVNYREAAKSRDPQFIPYPSTWFNQERFNDPIEAAPAKGPVSLFDRQIDRSLNQARCLYEIH